MGNLAGDCTDYEDSLKLWDPTLIVAKQQDPKVRGYVYKPELGVAKTYVKDVVGILGKERRGRTSPNGNANHVHVLGDASLNAIFDWNGPGGAVRLLGFVVGHMDREASESVLTDAANVEAHANGGNFTLVEVDVIARTLVGGRGVTPRSYNRKTMRIGLRIGKALLAAQP